MARSSGQVSEHIGRWTRTLPSPALDTGEGVAELAVDSATSTLKFGAPGAVTKEVMDLSSTQTVTGIKSFNAPMFGVRLYSATTVGSGTLTTTVSGQVTICTATSGTQVFTLPLASAGAGLFYTFVCGHADSEIRVAVGTGDNIVGKTHGAENATGILTTATTGYLKNTDASNVVGDFCTLVSDGVTTWFMIAVAGVWAGA